MTRAQNHIVMTTAQNSMVIFLREGIKPYRKAKQVHICIYRNASTMNGAHLIYRMKCKSDYGNNAQWDSLSYIVLGSGTSELIEGVVL